MSALVVAELEPLCIGQPLRISAITHVRVDASLADLTEAVGSACEAGVVNEVAGARNTGHKNPVATVVDVKDDTLPCLKWFWMSLELYALPTKTRPKEFTAPQTKMLPET